MRYANVAGTLLLALSVNSTVGFGQVPAPRNESRRDHIFRTHREHDNLEERAHSLSCALVLIVAGDRTGTGFYISPDGDIVTAAHVLGEKTFVAMSSGQLIINIAAPPTISISASDNAPPTIFPTLAILENNADAWSADVALLKTGKKAVCWLKIQGEEHVRIGQHVLALGFPGLAFGSLSMYTGIVSARLRSNLPIGKTIQGQPLTSNVDFIRVQMPISPGLSGAPLVDDENRVVGVLTSAGAWSQDLDLLLQWERFRERQMATSPNPNVDPSALVVELAEMFHDYGSPGYGDAVPMRYLKKLQVTSPPPEAPAH
jgi:V8-like Glu-specific endopeptidase